MIIEILLGLAKFNSLYSIFFSSMEVHIIYVEKKYTRIIQKICTRIKLYNIYLIYLIPLFYVGQPSCWTFGRGHPGDNPGLEPWSILLWAGW